MNIRKGTPDDLASVYDLVLELAVYEKACKEVDNSAEQMLEDGFGQNSIFEFFVAENEKGIVGTAIYYYRYSTWKGKTIYLEDLIVREKERGKGYGKKLLAAVVLEARATNSKQIRWQVLDWNEPAINFYQKLGASVDSEWLNCTLTEEQIRNW